MDFHSWSSYKEVWCVPVCDANRLLEETYLHERVCTEIYVEQLCVNLNQTLGDSTLFITQWNIQ